MKHLLPALLIGSLLACGGEAVRGRPALAEFGAGGPAPAESELPLTVAAPDFSADKALDAALGLAFIAALLGIGRLIRSALPGFKPFALAGVGVAVMAIFFTNTRFYEFASVTVDASGITVTRHVGGEERVDFRDVTDVRVEPGKPYPVFTDDRSLVIAAGTGRSVSIPFFVPDRERLGALLASKLGL